MSKTLLAVFASVLLLAMVPVAAFSDTVRTYNKPRQSGDRLDWCFAWSAGCGAKAAKAFCKARGFDTAKRFAIDKDIGARTRTRLISTGAVCDQSFCDGFKFIQCSKAVARINNPRFRGDRLDWCYSWGQGCGQQAATAYCKARGFNRARAFRIAENIGARQRTRVISTGAVCDQGFCDGFRFIECE